MSETIEYGALDAETIAELLGVTTRQLSNYCKNKHLPSYGEGRQRTFVWKEVLAWYVDYKQSTSRYAGSGGNQGAGNGDDTSVPDLKHSEARRGKALADLKEIELQKKLGELVAMNDVGRILQDVAKGLQTEILGLPSRIVEQVLVIRERAELFTFLTSEAAALCTRLSTLRVGSAADLQEPDDKPEPDRELDDAEA